MNGAMVLIGGLISPAMNVLADWHSHHGGGSSSTPPTPEQEAVYVAVACVILVGLGLSALNLLGGGLLVFLTRRKRDAFWLVPLSNMVLYAVAVLLRPHPLGLGALFNGWNLLALAVEMLIILILSLVWVSLLTLVRWGIEKLRVLGKRGNVHATPPGQTAHP